MGLVLSRITQTVGADSPPEGAQNENALLKVLCGIIYPGSEIRYWDQSGSSREKTIISLHHREYGPVSLALGIAAWERQVEFQIKLTLALNTLLKRSAAATLQLCDPMSVSASQQEWRRYGIFQLGSHTAPTISGELFVCGELGKIAATIGSATDLSLLPRYVKGDFRLAGGRVHQSSGKRAQLILELQNVEGALRESSPYKYKAMILVEGHALPVAAASGNGTITLKVGDTMEEDNNGNGSPVNPSASLQGSNGRVVLKLGELELTPEQLLEVRPGSTLSFKSPEVLKAIIEVDGTPWAEAEVEWSPESVVLNITKMS